MTSILAMPECQKGLIAANKKRSRTGKKALTIDSSSFTSKIKKVDGLERPHYNANFDNKIGTFLKSGLVHILFSKTNGIADGGMVTLSKKEVDGSTVISSKVPNSGSFTKYSNELFESVGLKDQESYILHPLITTADLVVFRLAIHIKGSGIVTSDPILTISAPKQNGREEELGLKSLSKIPDSSGYELYRKDCDLSMASTTREFSNRIGKSENRDLPDCSRDHIFSVYDGYRKKVPPVIMSHYSNLQWLSRPDNASKGNASWKTYHQLIDDYASATGSSPSKILELLESFDNQRYEGI